MVATWNRFVQIWGNREDGNGIHGNRYHGNDIHGNRNHRNGIHGNRYYGNGIHGNRYHGNGIHIKRNNGNGIHGNCFNTCQALLVDQMGSFGMAARFSELSTQNQHN